MKWIVLSILFQSSSVILGKKASMILISYNIKEILANEFYILSLVCLALQAITWQQALRKIQLNHAYLFMSSVQIFVIIASYYIFHEQISIQNVIGAFIIISGLNILYFNGKREKA